MAENSHKKTSNKRMTIALSGNPNAGKTTVFNALTGARQHIANYPGVTVEKKYGKIDHKGFEITVVDLPGTYSLTAYSLEEIVARNFLIDERPDVVVDIVDASNLDRNLYLAIQFRELGIPLIIALNMVDLASTRGIIVDEAVLSSMLGVPVVPMVARTKKGLDDLLEKIIEVAGSEPAWKPERISYGGDIDQGLEEIEGLIRNSSLKDDKYPRRWLALKCMEGDRQVLEKISRDHETAPKIQAICRKTEKHMMATLEEDPESIVADHRYGYIAGITKAAIKRKIESRLNFSDKIDRVLTNRVLGPLIMMGILYAIYEFTFWGSEVPVSWVEGFFGWLKEAVSWAIPEGYLHSLIVAGIIDGVGGVLGFVPLIMFMFFSIAFMEDSGYMARVAYMLDRVLRWFGLHGNSVMALIVSGGISGGCAVPGVMATRTLRDPKERIATLLVVPFMNCGAKLPLFGMLIAAFFQKREATMLFFFTLLSWFFALFAAKFIRATVLKGPKTPFVMELPPYRFPTFKGLLIHTWERTWQYMKKAGTIILCIAVLLWAVMTFPEPSQDRTRFFQDRRVKNMAAFLREARGHLRGEEDLKTLDRLFETSGPAAGKEGQAESTPDKKPELSSIVRRAIALKRGQPVKGEDKRDLTRVALAYIAFLENRAGIDNVEQEEALRGTIAGRIGQALESVTGPIGFDYRTNIALIGGFVAKEVIVSTLGTAYSLGEVSPDKSDSLSERLKKNPDWNPLVAFCLILFTMLYVPCFVTVISIKKESSWGWAGFSILFNLITAYAVTFVVYQIGSALGLGL
ncbi:MAG: ferrous iron transport protein B [Pseudomonadota bacterium]